MLDLFTILTKGGIVLWHYQQHTTINLVHVLNELISQVILLERFHLATFPLEQLLLKFKLDNQFELIFVIAYQKIAKLMEIDKLIETLFSAFRNLFAERLKLGGYFNCSQFDDIFYPILKKFEVDNFNSLSSTRTMKTFTESKKFSKLSEAQKHKTESALNPPSDLQAPDSIENGHEDSDNEPTTSNSTQSLESSTMETTSQSKVRSHKPLQVDRVGGARKARSKIKTNQDIKSTKKSDDKTAPQKRQPKMERSWDGQISRAEAESLDYSQDKGSQQEISAASYMPDTNSVSTGMKGDLSGIDTLKPPETKSPPVSRFMSMLGGLTGSKPVGRDRLLPVLEAVKEHLISKNVAAEISENLCRSVLDQVEGRTLSTFSTVRSTVQQALRDSLSQILMPRRNINVLREIIGKKSSGANKPYIMTFCGVNGVGKSTSLAKICFWLLENEFRVLIAACDTFRSGAVEQLQTHTKCLQSLYPVAEGEPKKVALYANKMNKDASAVASEGILQGIRDGYDVIMVDTAGRMQDNQPLMQALGKLIYRNSPDLVLFVGEALVGNEGVDQLLKFNQSLVEYSAASGPLSSSKESLIDGILLTKFDTIDDKVGAAISMTYATGHPIIFVGTGQKYTDLKSFSAQSVLNTLLK